MKINQRYRLLIYWILILVIIIFAIIVPAHHHAARQHLRTEKTTAKKVDKNKVADHMRTPIDYRKSSETIPYPNLKEANNLWIKVVISKNRAYVYDGSKLIYTMYCSAGKYYTDPKTGKPVKR